MIKEIFLPERLGKNRVLAQRIIGIAIQEDFYSHFKVVGTTEVKVKPGNSIAYIAKRNKVPLWLMKKQQPKGEYNGLLLGQKINIPSIEPIAGRENGLNPPETEDEPDDDQG